MHTQRRTHELSRRACLSLGAGAALAALPSWGLQRESLAHPLRLGCDEAVVNSGLASLWQRAFARDTGLVLSLIVEPASRILEMLERAEVDMSLTNVPPAETRLVEMGLAHERTRVAISEFVLVGPEAVQKTLQPVPLKLNPQALLPLLAGTKTPFLSKGDQSGTHLFEQSLWLARRITPTPNWYHTALASIPIWLQASESNACTLVERGVWERAGRPSGLSVWSDNSAEWEVEVHLMRAFRINHPAARLLTQWVSGPRGRALAAKHPGYRVA